MYIIGLREAKAYGGMEVARSSLYSFLTSVLVVSGQLHASAAVPRGKENVYTRSILDSFGPRSWSGRFGNDIKVLPILGIEPRFIILIFC